jgi:hypothetical protein
MLHPFYAFTQIQTLFHLGLLFRLEQWGTFAGVALMMYGLQIIRHSEYGIVTFVRPAKEIQGLSA